MDETQRNDVARVCRDVLGPLIRGDGGTLHSVQFNGDEVHLHLVGTCSGCPGVATTRDSVIVPALRSVAPNVRVVVTTGFPLPEGVEPF
jgi:Fe-S cluster biogenesis protein NfuA